MSKRKFQQGTTEIPVGADPGDVLRITPLGAGNEVGRSCIVIEYKGKTVMLDCGIHPAYSGLAALPFFDEIDPGSVDVVLVTHFHLDHAASLPYFVEKTSFKGKVFMTHPTRAIYKWLLADYVRVSGVAGGGAALYDEADLTRSYAKITAVDYHQQVETCGIRFTAYNAGHVLGAAMFVIEVGGVRILYTGDYSREEDRHLMAAEAPPGPPPDVLIAEATYGVQSHEPRPAREARFTSLVHNAVLRGGRCLIPVFALGRAQELLLILDEFWHAHPDLHHIPIYYASSLAKKCMTVYQTFINMMNARIRKQAKDSNPFVFKHISNLKGMDSFEDVGPCVMMASPGMLQSGLSRELLELWCVDKRNAVVIPGYVVEGTLAKHILSEPNEIVSMAGAKLPLRLSVDYVSFSAHVDYVQNAQFIEEVASKNLVLVHGDGNEMNRLRMALTSKYADREDSLVIYTPRNCESVRLYFRGEKMAKILGSLAKPINDTALPPLGHAVSGLLVQRDYQYHIIAPQDLQEFTELKPTSIKARQLVPYRAPWNLLVWGVRNMWGDVHESYESADPSDPDCEKAVPVLQVFGCVVIRRVNEKAVIVEWESDPMSDVVSDSVTAVILRMESCPASVKATTIPCTHAHHESKPHNHSPKLEQSVPAKKPAAGVLGQKIAIDPELLANLAPAISETIEAMDVVETGDASKPAEAETEKDVPVGETWDGFVSCGDVIVRGEDAALASAPDHLAPKNLNHKDLDNKGGFDKDDDLLKDVKPEPKFSSPSLFPTAPSHTPPIATTSSFSHDDSSSPRLGFAWYVTRFLRDQIGESVVFLGSCTASAPAALSSGDIQTDDAEGRKVFRWKFLVDEEIVYVLLDLSGTVEIKTDSDLTRKRLETIVGRITKTLLPVRTTWDPVL